MVKLPYHKVRLNQEFKVDLRWWLKFASIFNGSANICPHHLQTLCTYSDASQFGFATLHAGDCLTGSWGPGKGLLDLGHHTNQPFRDCVDGTGELGHINALEFWPILCAAKRWAARNVVMITDNTTVVHTLNSGSSKNSLIMNWLYNMFWLAVKFNFDISSVYIKSADNTVCDSVSRLNEIDAHSCIAGVMGAEHICCSHIFY